MVHQAFFAQFCLLMHLYAGTIRYAEALEMIRKLLDLGSDVGDSEDSTAEGSSEDFADGDVCTNACDESDEDSLPFALPVECSLQSAIAGTRTPKVGSRVSFDVQLGPEVEECVGGYHTPHKPVTDDDLDARRLGHKHEFVQAIARARSMRCVVVQDQPIRERQPLCEAHRTIFIREGDEALILDRRCDWSVDGFEGHYRQAPEVIPRCNVNDIAMRDDLVGAMFYTEDLKRVSTLDEFLNGGFENDGCSAPIDLCAVEVSAETYDIGTPVSTPRSVDSDVPWLNLNFEAEDGAEDDLEISFAATPAYSFDDGRGAIVKVKRWIIDTGCGFDLIARALLTGNLSVIQKALNSIAFNTANGVAPTDEQALIHVEELGQNVRAWVMQRSPAVLSVGLRCMEQGLLIHLDCWSDSVLDHGGKHDC